MVREFDIEKDIGSVMAMGRKMHSVSIFRNMEYNINRALYFCTVAATDNDYCFFVSESGGQLSGFFIGRAMEHFFSTEIYSIDLLLWVEEEYRGGPCGKELVQAYREWASDSGVALEMIGSSTGIDIDRTKKFYEHLGYNCVGHNFIGE